MPRSQAVALRAVPVAMLALLGGLASFLSADSSQVTVSRSDVQDVVRPGLPANGGPTPDPSTTRSGTATPSIASIRSAAIRRVRAENARAGTPGWQISAPRGEASGLAAYADRLSVLPGQPVRLFADARGTVTVRAFRIGWYDGVGARQVWHGSFDAGSQPAVDPARWRSGLQVSTSGWPQGHYLLRLDRGSASRYVPLTIRSPDAAGRLLLVSSPLSWQATNPVPPTGAVGSSASPAVAFDRPYANGFGAAGMLRDDAPIVRLAEREGLPLAYATDYDLALNPALLTGATAVVFGGGATFWTDSVRAAVSAAVADRVDLAAFGAGTGSRRITLVGSNDGSEPATQFATQPGALPRFESVDAAAVSTASLTGTEPVCEAAQPPALTVVDASWWGFAGTKVRDGQRLPGLAGTLDAAVPGMPGLQPVSTAVIGCGRRKVRSGVTVYRTEPAAGSVFVAGTSRWACGSSGVCDGPALAPRIGRVLARVTRNVLTAFAEPVAAAASTTQAGPGWQP